MVRSSTMLRHVSMLCGVVLFCGPSAGLELPSALTGAVDIIPEAIRCNLCRTAKLYGPVSDCACDFELQDTGFFRHFKVNLDSGCPFWDDSQELCAMKACAVETCGPGDVPQPWLEGAEGAEGGEGANDTGEGEACGPLSTAELMMRYVTRTGDDAMEVERWSEGESSDVWIDQNEEKGMVFVDLKLNPERYTGYSGPSANRVWRAIHEENCFSFDNDGQCLEKRVFFRLISGLQASISTHIAREYYYGSDFGDDDGTWGPNLKLFVERVGSHEDRLHNMYFAYLFLLRAVAKAAPELELFDYNTGNTTDDARVVSLVKALVRPDHPLVDASTAAQTCQHGFDESKLFQVQSGNYALDELNDLEQHLMQQRALDLKREFQGRFRNISRIMDCVGCEKCRLWGKLQILGIGTALKVLMTNDDNLHLQRNEVIALLNTLGQVSRSVKLVQDWRHQEFENAILTLGFRLAALSFLPWLVFRIAAMLLRWRWTAKWGAKMTAKPNPKAKGVAKG